MRGRVAFVSSGARGLGHTIVQSLMEAGWNVFFTYHTSAVEADSLVAYSKQCGVEAACTRANLLQRNEVQAAVQACQERFGKVDAVIHNFGPFEFNRMPLVQYSDQRWDEIFDGNLNNLFWILRDVIPGMREQAFGRIVTVGFDGAGRAAGWRYRAPYAAAKAALAALTRSIAREERQSGITANMVCPGDIRGSHKMHMIRDVKQAENPLGRPAVGEDVARLAVWLCDENSQQINGTVTEVTGGYDILAYDDGKDVVQEPTSYALGDTVWVLPWQAPAIIDEVEKIPNRYILYTVVDGQKRGTFTAFQLTTPDEE